MTRTPWWYSGEGEQQPEPVPDPRAETSSAEGSASDQQEGSRPGTDWGALLSGAQRLVDWATETVMAPHSEHTDPREHPDCVICKAIALLPEGTRLTSSSRADDAEAASPAGEDAPTTSPEVPSIEWIPIRGDRPAL